MWLRCTGRSRSWGSEISWEFVGCGAGMIGLLDDLIVWLSVWWWWWWGGGGGGKGGATNLQAIEGEGAISRAAPVIVELDWMTSAEKGCGTFLHTNGKARETHYMSYKTTTDLKGMVVELAKTAYGWTIPKLLSERTWCPNILGPRINRVKR